jgi:hypothetical protein
VVKKLPIKQQTLQLQARFPQTHPNQTLHQILSLTQTALTNPHQSHNLNHQIQAAKKMILLKKTPHNPKRPTLIL